MVVHDENHPFWQHQSPQRKTARARTTLKLQRFWAWLQGKKQRLAMVLGFYLMIWFIPLALGQPLITVFALLPLLVVPPVGLLVYWLIWREFHG